MGRGDDLTASATARLRQGLLAPSIVRETELFQGYSTALAAAGGPAGCVVRAAKRLTRSNSKLPPTSATATADIPA